MKRPEDIPDALVEKAMHSVRPAMREDVTRYILASAWDAIYAEGYTDGFQDQEGAEIQAEALKQGEWAPRIFIWMDGANQEQAEEIFETITDFSHDLDTDGVTLTMGAVLAPGKRRFPERGASTN